MGTKIQKVILVAVILFSLIAIQMMAQEKSKSRTGEEMEIVGLGFEKKIMANTEITKATVIFTQTQNIDLPDAAPKRLQKSQFDVVLRSRIVTNNNGEFTISIPVDQFRKIPDSTVFDLRLKIKPPKGFMGIFDTDVATIKLGKADGPRYELILGWIPDPTKTNKGTFAVSSKAQT